MKKGRVFLYERTRYRERLLDRLSAREAVVQRLVEDREFMEDLIDLVILAQRDREPSRPLDAYLHTIDDSARTVTVFSVAHRREVYR